MSVSQRFLSAGAVRCRGAARNRRWRGKSVVTVLGPVRVSRAYYHCTRCHHGHCPRDAALGVTAVCLSRGACEALASALSSFAETATKTLSKLAGLVARL